MTANETGLTELERAKIVVRIDEVEQRLTVAQKNYKDLRESNLSAARSYGSELCAGDMEKREKEKEDVVTALRKTRDRLRDVLMGQVMLTRSELEQLLAE